MTSIITYSKRPGTTRLVDKPILQRSIELALQATSRESAWGCAAGIEAVMVTVYNESDAERIRRAPRASTVRRHRQPAGRRAESCTLDQRLADQWYIPFFDRV